MADEIEVQMSTEVRKTDGRIRREHEKIRVALVGVATDGNAPGGIASASLALISGFKGDSMIDIIPITNFDEGSTFRRLIMGLGAIWQFLKRSREIDVVHVQVATGWSIERELLFAFVARFRRRPVIAQFHGFDQIDDYSNGSSIHRYFYRALIRISHNVTLGPNTNAWLLSVNANARIVTVPNGVDVGHEARPFPSGLPSIVFVGRIGKRKGVFDLLDACESLHKEGIRFRLNILGDGDIPAVEDRVSHSENLSECVSVLGWCDQKSVSRAISDSWVLVLPSYAEGLPMAILESMASGRAVIATRVGEIESAVVNGVNGFLIDSGDTQALQEALREILGNREFAQLLGINGHLNVRAKFSSGAMLKQMKTVYLSTARGSSKRDHSLNTRVPKQHRHRTI